MILNDQGKTTVKKAFILILIAVLLFGTVFSVSAETGDPAKRETDYTSSGITEKMKDGKYSTYSSVTEFSYSGSAVKYIYIVFWDEPCEFTVETNGDLQKFNASFLHYNTELKDPCGEFSVKFDKSVKISEVRFYTEGALPNDVQCWQDNDTAADLLLFSTHADDEQLFFAGILPYYAVEKGYRVQVVYFTDHNNTVGRRHELLDGLWTVGVKRYPVISKFPDMWSETYNGALANLKKSGFSENDVYSFQVEMLRRFKPLVLVEHDLEGEYKHGQHIMNSVCMTKSVEYAADPDKFPESYNKYGVWDTPKMYVHLYNKNTVSIDFIDVPTEKLGNKSPFQIT